MTDIWRVRLERAEPAHHGHVFDATTGADVSKQFPARCARRLVRSRDTGQPVRLTVFRLNEAGRQYLDAPDHVAVEVRHVLVVE